MNKYMYVSDFVGYIGVGMRCDDQNCKLRETHLNFHAVFQCNLVDIEFLANSKHAHLVFVYCLDKGNCSF
jgi:hypothetical protein